MISMSEELFIQLVSNEIDRDALLAEIVRKHPDVVSQCFGIDTLVEKVRRAYEENNGPNKVSAIKMHRAETGASLKESKDIVEEWLANGTLRPMNR